MQKNNGYTIPELIVVTAIVGIFASIAITKISYSFDNNDTASIIETHNKILIKSATLYAESIQEKLISEKVVYVSAKDLEEAGYLADATNYEGFKIKIEYDDSSTSFTVNIIE